LLYNAQPAASTFTLKLCSKTTTCSPKHFLLDSLLDRQLLSSTIAIQSSARWVQTISALTLLVQKKDFWIGMHLVHLIVVFCQSQNLTSKSFSMNTTSIATNSPLEANLDFLLPAE